MIRILLSTKLGLIPPQRNKKTLGVPSGGFRFGVDFVIEILYPFV